MRLEVHAVNRCGFYVRTRGTKAFGGLATTMGDLQAWLSTRLTIASTELGEREGERLLCADCFGSSQDGWGLKLWHGTPAAERGVAYLSTIASPGANVTASEQRIPANSMPGWPSYFWLGTIAGVDYVAALRNTGRIQNRGTGLPSLRDYFTAYMNQVSSYVVRDPDGDNDYRIVGYRNNANEMPRSDLLARFDTHPLLLPGSIDAIKSRINDIRKLVTVCKVSRTLPDQISFVERALHAAGWMSYQEPPDDTFHFRWETDWRPTEQHFDQLLHEYHQHRQEEERSERVGVRYSGTDARVHWFDSVFAEADIDLPEILENAFDWNRDQLKDAAARARAQIVNLIGVAIAGT